VLVRACSYLTTSSFLFTHPAPPQTYTLSLHDALPISADDGVAAVQDTHGGSLEQNGPRRLWLPSGPRGRVARPWGPDGSHRRRRSEEHTSELQSRGHLVCRLLLEKKKKKKKQ